jgi:polyhydroxyalkanoate synthesis regulator phasin
MSQKPDEQQILDPFGVWKSMRDSGMDAWSKMMIQLVNTEAYAQANATMMDAWLTTSAPFRKVIESTMTQVFTQLNMPMRSDVTGLAERLTHIEMRLDDIEAKLDERPRPESRAASGKAKDTSA